MDFKDRIESLASQSRNRINQIRDEAGTKQALVLPFLAALGYDIYDTTEVDPEHPADVGIKKGEKVDYAICLDGTPVIIIECKSVKSSLQSADISQLFRYFTATDAKFGVLTNGGVYYFYSDLKAPNKMDDQPFMRFDLQDFTSQDVENLELFSKDSIDLSETPRAVSNIKYTADIKQFLSDQINKPDDDFVLYVRDRVCPKSETRPGREQFMELLRECLRDLRRGHRKSIARYRGGVAGGHGTTGGTTAEPVSVTPPIDEPKGPTTIVEYAVVVLDEAKTPLGATEMARRIVSRGYKSTAKNPVDTLRSTIWDETKRPSPRIVKDGKNYGLPQWYQKSGVVVPISGR